MKHVHVTHRGSNTSVGRRIGVADSWWLRLRGLLGRPRLAAEEGLLLLGCASVHTMGMRHVIDVAFLDAQGTVVASIPRLEPWRLGLGGPKAVHTLELRAGRLEETSTVPGVRLTWSGATEATRDPGGAREEPFRPCPPLHLATTDGGMTT